MKKTIVIETGEKTMQEKRCFQAFLPCDEGQLCPEYVPQKPHIHLWDWASGEQFDTWSGVA